MALVRSMAAADNVSAPGAILVLSPQRHHWANWSVGGRGLNYALHLCILLSIYAILALGLNFVVGYCGLLVLSHAAYFAAGAYAYALASMKLGWSFLPAAALAVAASMILSLAV